MLDFEGKLKGLVTGVVSASKHVGLEAMRERVAILDAEMCKEGFWSDAAHAGAVAQEVDGLKKQIAAWEEMISDVTGYSELIGEMSEAEAESVLNEMTERWEGLRVSTYLTGKFDKANAILSVICGTGGKDAQDFTEMLFRMYSRYAEKSGFKAEIVDVTQGEEVGYKNATVKISGLNAYGLLKFEHGVHRLVRLSSSNAGNTRETSFAKVDVVPEINFNDEIEIDEKDLRIDVYRASGAGGQHVNKTESAVRITHLPTNIVVQCQSERSQGQNKETAMSMLKGKLFALMQEKHLEKLEDLRGVKTEVSWGNQIRSYVLHPYKLVKDHRTDYEESNPDAVFDGKLDGFIKNELQVLSLKK